LPDDGYEVIFLVYIIHKFLNSNLQARYINLNFYNNSLEIEESGVRISGSTISDKKFSDFCLLTADFLIEFSANARLIMQTFRYSIEL
jgi:hypothetical protein